MESEVNAIEKEVMLRGTVMKISTLLEMALAKIIIISNPYNAKEEISKFKDMMFGGKIKRAKKLLSKHHPALFTEFKSVFKSLDKVKDFRNKMAHCSIYWHEPSFMSFELWDESKKEDNSIVLEATIYTMQECVLKIDELRKTFLEVQKLDVKVSEIIEKSHPQFSGLLKPEDSVLGRIFPTH